VAEPLVTRAIPPDPLARYTSLQRFSLLLAGA
jgi:hypothetical protein